MFQFIRFSRGYIEIILLIMVAIVVLVVAPVKFPQLQNTAGNLPCSKPLTSSPTINLPSYTVPSKSDEGAIIGSDTDVAIYKLLIANLPVNKLTDHTQKWNKSPFVHPVNSKNYDVYYPIFSGEISLQPQTVISKYKHPGEERDLLYFVDWGLVFLVHLTNSAPDKVDIGGKEYWITDIYQDENHNGLIPASLDIFGCNKTTTTTKIYKPSAQKISDDKKELQLEYFLFEAPGGKWDVVCKPAIYLYPKEETKINVKVKTKGFLTYVDPPYPETGWDVLAYPDGTIYNLTNNYEPITNNYLYYESKVPDELIDKPKEGYVLEWSKLNEFYELVLPTLGLNETQTKDFKNYWEKALPYSPYYFVGVIDQTNIDSFEPLEVTPKPDLSIRVRLYFQALEKKPIDDLQYFPAMNHELITHNLKLIEWGGMVKTNPLDKFTCSQ